MPPHRTQLLARALAAVCLVALIIGIAVIVLSCPDGGHPPERVTAGRTVVINPTAIPAELVPTTPSTSTTTSTTVAVATTASTSTAAHASGDVETAIRRWFGDLYDQAHTVAMCESSLNSGAVGGNNYGLFQISDVHADDFETVTGVAFVDGWMVADLNAMYARKLFDGHDGWGPWSCKP